MCCRSLGEGYGEESRFWEGEGEHEVRVTETLAADGHAARRRRRTRIAAQGRTLALGAENERNCRHLYAPAPAA
ncbi:hypothetical protein EVAR_86927_1 [Eumeta japonica]|uniref:Uncharacterized protein n=1 Tax=Eumeta variegata TaxID=151549 RepID=A0A4C1W958_EUMVA|nr:hypothetical protein EVAR_86927_1 [Eumeta japonica]